jgi:hypothetical protein
MIILRHNNPQIKEKIFRGEAKYVKRYLPEAADALGRGEIYTQGVIKGVKNNILTPIREQGVRLKGKIKKKSKDQVTRDIAAFRANEARKKLPSQGHEVDNILDKIKNIKTNTSSLTKPASVPYPDKLAVHADSNAIRTIADEGNLWRSMKKIVGKSRKRVEKKADREARRMVTSLAPQF